MPSSRTSGRVSDHVHVLTQAQLDAQAQAHADATADGLTPVQSRIAHSPEYGTLLYVAVALPEDTPLSDCECGTEHVMYTTVRADGASVPITVSGSFEETFLSMMGAFNSPLWDAAEPLDPGSFVIDGLNVPDTP